MAPVGGSCPAADGLEAVRVLVDGIRDGARVWLGSLVVGLVGAAVAWLTLPHGREVGSFWEYVAQLAVFA